MSRTIDWWIIGKFEAFSRFTNRWIGVDRNHWTRVFLILKASNLAFCKYFLKLPSMDTRFLDVLAPLVLLTTVHTFYLTFHEPNYTEQRLMNPRKQEFWWRNIGLFLAVSFLPMDMFTLDLWWQFSMVAEYFLACDDDTTSVSRLKEWLRNLRSHQHQVAIPA